MSEYTIAAAKFAEAVGTYRFQIPSRETHIRPLLERLETWEAATEFVARTRATESYPIDIASWRRGRLELSIVWRPPKIIANQLILQES
jgi:hypothetical protein